MDSDPNWIRVQQHCGSCSVFRIRFRFHTGKKEDKSEQCCVAGPVGAEIILELESRAEIFQFLINRYRWRYLFSAVSLEDARMKN